MTKKEENQKENDQRAVFGVVGCPKEEPKTNALPLLGHEAWFNNTVDGINQLC